jgi:hypothetical protein
VSEYQYYEFQAIDKPLSTEQREAVQDLSSRGIVTLHSAAFTYNYSDFGGSVKQLMSDMFDVMLYVANWGSQRLVIRIPQTLLNVKDIDIYCLEDVVSYFIKDEYIIIDCDFNDDEGYSDWIEGEGLLGDILAIRDEIIQGDYRALYLAWLKAVDQVKEYNDDDERDIYNRLEPTVPAGLDKLSSAQREFAKFIELDSILIECAAATSTSFEATQFQAEEWLHVLSKSEKEDFLQRLCRNEAALSLQLNKHLQSLANVSSGHSSQSGTTLRTVDEIYDSYEQIEARERLEQVRIADQKQQLHLNTVKSREGYFWQEIPNLVLMGHAKSYDQATTYLCDLHALAIRENNLASFNAKLLPITTKFSRRTAFIRRLKENDLISK